VATVLRPGVRMLDWAETQAGKPYEWSGTGPWGYDCSGLVVAAARHIGLVLPRTTYEMVWSRHLRRVYHPRRGDLAFFGSIGAPYHVEFVTAWRSAGFGALQSGVPVGYDQWGSWWRPSAYYRVVR
jgi:peptidoglycan DL-endopeptidase CwlO